MPTKTITPVGDRILVKRDESETQTPGGIVLPDNAQEKATRGRVVAVGFNDGEPPQINEGDTIMFGRYAGTEVEIDDVEYVVLKEEDVLLVIR